MQLAAPSSLPHLNPLLRLHPFANRGHQAVLGSDTGILIRNTTWEIEESSLSEYFTYARVHIPDSEPALGTNVRVLHLWSIHAPPIDADRTAFWNADVPGISRLDAAAAQPNSVAIVGSDWNAVGSPILDEFPRSNSSRLLPLGQLAHAGLVDSFCTLHPTGIAYTRHNVVRGEMTAARRIDSVWVSQPRPTPPVHDDSAKPLRPQRRLGEHQGIRFPF